MKISMGQHAKGLGMALAASLVAGLGCGAGPNEERIAKSQEGLTVSTWSDLLAMGETGSYVLTQDINASGKTWTPKDFSGSFDGGNHIISNLTVSDGGFFAHLNNGSVKNLQLTNMNVSGANYGGAIGALANYSNDSVVENCSVEANVNVDSAVYAGNMFGTMNGGSLTRSYSKGNLTGVVTYVGGLVGASAPGDTGMPSISQSYSQVRVAPSIPSDDWVYAGGLVGSAYASDIHDVYSVGDVSGYWWVGGLIGYAGCTESYNFFFLYNGIHRGGDVVDPSYGTGWGGTIGGFDDCSNSRMGLLFWETSTDPSYTQLDFPGHIGATTEELRSPTTPAGGVFCQLNPDTGHCADDGFDDPPWYAGTDMEHHTLELMPGPNVQIR